MEEGGETVFPASRRNFSTIPGWNERSECAKRGLSVKPVRGDALLFWSMRPDATLDPASLHGWLNFTPYEPIFFTLINLFDVGFQHSPHM